MPVSQPGGDREAVRADSKAGALGEGAEWEADGQGATSRKRGG